MRARKRLQALSGMIARARTSLLLALVSRAVVVESEAAVRGRAKARATVSSRIGELCAVSVVQLVLQSSFGSQTR